MLLIAVTLVNNNKRDDAAHRIRSALLRGRGLVTRQALLCPSDQIVASQLRKEM